MKATSAARWVAGAVLILGCATVLLPAVLHGEIVFTEDPFEPRETVVTVVKTGPDGETVTRTTSEADQSFVERSLAAGGLLLLRLGIVAMAAFLAGAVVQRTLIGDFTVKLGPLEFPELKEVAAASRQALEKVVARLRKQEERLAKSLLAEAEATEAQAALTKRIAALEKGLAPLLAMLGTAEPPPSKMRSTSTTKAGSVELEKEKKPRARKPSGK